MNLQHIGMPTLALLLSACASDPSYKFYERQPGAHEVFDVASAACYADINSKDGSPSWPVCMRAKGWKEVGSCSRDAECIRQ
jgi:hypothetical protein